MTPSTPSTPADAAPRPAFGPRRPAGGSAPVARPQGQGGRPRCLAFVRGGRRCPAPSEGGRWGARYLCREHARSAFLALCVETLDLSRRAALAESGWETESELNVLLELTR
jgi:hypothetical protein